MTKILIVGDLHLGRLVTLFNEWQTWSFAPLEQALAYAIKHNIKHIIQVGDVFDDPNPSQELLLKLIDWLKQAETLAPNIIIHFQLGNHDKEDRNKNSLILLKYLSKKYHIKNCKVYIKPSKVLIGKIKVVFLPWPLTTSKYLKGKAALVIAHIERKGLHYDNGRRIKDNDFDLGKHFWILGHQHEPQLQKNLINVGAPLQLRHGDKPEKYLWHLDIKYKEKKLKVRFKKIAVDLPYKLSTIRVNNISEQDWQRKFNNLDDKTFVRLQVHQDIALPDKYINHPQVLTVEPFGHKTMTEVFEQNNFKETDINSTKQRRKALKFFLGKMGMQPRKLKRAVRLADKLETKLDHQSNLGSK